MNRFNRELQKKEKKLTVLKKLSNSDFLCFGHYIGDYSCERYKKIFTECKICSSLKTELNLDAYLNKKGI